MPAPIDHNRRQGAVEELMRRIPGFHGYLERTYRRESDALLRRHLAEQLERVQRRLQGVAREFADPSQTNSLPQLDQVREKLDKIVNRLRGPLRGYSGVFDLVRIDGSTLDSLYASDLSLADQAEAMVRRLERGGRAPPLTAAAMADMTALLEEAERACEKRDDILKRLV